MTNLTKLNDELPGATTELTETGGTTRRDHLTETGGTSRRDLLTGGQRTTSGGDRQEGHQDRQGLPHRHEEAQLRWLPPVFPI